MPCIATNFHLNFIVFFSQIVLIIIVIDNVNPECIDFSYDKLNSAKDWLWTSFDRCIENLSLAEDWFKNRF